MCALLLSASGGVLHSGERLQLPEGFPLWQPSADLRLGVGYKDNVTLSSYAPQGSGFESATAEVMLFRLPWNNWQFNAFVNATDTRYFDQSLGVDTEQNAAASAEITWFMGKGWKSVSSLQYLYINQVMDVSDTYGTSVREQVIGQGLTGKETIRKDFESYWVEAGVSVSRFLFRAPLDNYWQMGPRVSGGRSYGHGSELSLSYEILPLVYDTRTQADASGVEIPGTELQYLVQGTELAWRHYWDEGRHWRSTTRLSAEWNRDNGSGFYDYNEYRLVEELRYRPENWEFTLRLGLAYYDYPQHSISTDYFESRWRNSIQADFRAERRLSRHWKLFASYEYEVSLSNQQSEEYHVNTGSVGVEFAF
jgi:hypothetical protein